MDTSTIAMNVPTRTTPMISRLRGSPARSWPAGAAISDAGLTAGTGHPAGGARPIPRRLHPRCTRGHHTAEGSNAGGAAGTLLALPGFGGHDGIMVQDSAGVGEGQSV